MPIKNSAPGSQSRLRAASLALDQLEAAPGAVDNPGESCEAAVEELRAAAREIGDKGSIVIPEAIADAHQERIVEIRGELRGVESVPGSMNQRLRLLNELSELRCQQAEGIRRWWKERQILKR